MYEVMVENVDFRDNTAIHFAELVTRGIDVIHAGNRDVLLGPYTDFEGVLSMLESIGNGAVEE